jgi:hypothetical protein
MKHFFTTLGTLAALVLAAGPAQAQHRVEPGVYQRADGSVKPNATAHTAPAPAPAPSRLGGSQVTLTQNASQAIEPSTGVACTGGDNHFYRVFDLSTSGLSAGLDVTSVGVGIEMVGGPNTATVSLHRLTGEFVLANLTLVGTSAAVPISFSNDFSILDIPVTGTFAGTDRLVVELYVPNPNFFPGANSAGQAGPTYTRAAPCFLTEPTDLAALGFPDSHWVVNVHGTANPIPGPNLFVSPSSVSYGRVPTDSTSEAATVTLTNIGTAAVTISSITGSGAPFAVNTAGTDFTLDPGQSTTFTVTFSPTENGPATGTVSVVSNAPGSPLTINLSGVGAGPPPNDDFADATLIPSVPATLTGTNVDATLEKDEPETACARYRGVNSVWFVYTPTADGLLLDVDLRGSDFQTLVSVFDASLNELGCSINYGGTF